MPVNCLRYAAWTLSFLYAAFSTAPAMAASGDAAPAGSERLSLGVRGVYFVPNQGQWSDGGVHYGLRSRGLDVALRDSSLTMHMVREATEASPKRERGMLALDTPNPLFDGLPGAPADFEYLTLTLTFPGSNDVHPQGADPRSARFNYFVGGEGRSSASNVPSFGAVIYENLYDGIDLHVMGNDSGILKYEFHVAPGADPSQIAIAYDGIDSLCVDDSGDLQINTTFGTLTDAAPLVWQGDAASGAIPARFELVDDHIYRIALDGPVDPTRELIIDPDVEWMYYYGGSGTESCFGITTDVAGDSVITGSTTSTDFEGGLNSNHGYRDVFAAKVAASGELRWMTYLGGSDTEVGDSGRGVALDDTGHVFVSGTTASVDFEGRNNTYHGGGDTGGGDAFIVKLDSLGALQWMTYLGGSSDDWGHAIAIDGAGNAFAAGIADSYDFEGRNNSNHGGHLGYHTDSFVAKVSPEGAIQWMTYVGGSEGIDYGWDRTYAIATDLAGDVFITGDTTSDDFEGQRNNTRHGSDDAFVAKVSASGRAQWVTYLGGTYDESGKDLVLDGEGNFLVTGQTRSEDFEGRINSYHGSGFNDPYDAFVAKVDASGAVQWMNYLGGSADDWGRGIALTEEGGVVAAGLTSSVDFDGRTNSHHGDLDAFVVKIGPSGALQWMTFLGGAGREGGYDIAPDAGGAALVTGDTTSTDFEGRRNEYHGATDAFIVKILDTNPQLTVTATCPTGGPIQISWTGATPDGQVALLFARNTGSVMIPNGRPCSGTILGLGANQIQIAFRGSAGPDGSRTLNANAGPAACGGYLQLLDAATCSTSNVALIE